MPLWVNRARPEPPVEFRAYALPTQGALVVAKVSRPIRERVWRVVGLPTSLGPCQISNSERDQLLSLLRYELPNEQLKQCWHFQSWLKVQNEQKDGQHTLRHLTVNADSAISPSGITPNRQHRHSYRRKIILIKFRSQIEAV